MQQVHQLPCSEIAQRSVLASSSVPAPSPSPPFLYSLGVPGTSSLLPSVHTPQPLLNSSAVPTSSLANPDRNPMLLPPENLHVRSDLCPQLLHLHPSRSQPNILLQNCQVTYPQDFRLLWLATVQHVDFKMLSSLPSFIVICFLFSPRKWIGKC